VRARAKSQAFRRKSSKPCKSDYLVSTATHAFLRFAEFFTDDEIIKRSDTAKGFHVLPRRWVVERTFAWLGRCRRLAKDWEKSIESSTAWALIASIRMLTRRTAKYCYA
jgi:transposase